MDDYCEACCLARCDAYPSGHRSGEAPTREAGVIGMSDASAAGFSTSPDTRTFVFWGIDCDDCGGCTTFAAESCESCNGPGTARLYRLAD